jgi:phage shock protein PspC (stress-responsive transcriptional regulator)
MQFQSTLTDDVEVPATEPDIEATAAIAAEELGRAKLRNRFRLAAIAALVLIPIVAYLNARGVFDVNARGVFDVHPGGILFELGVVITITIPLPIIIVRLLATRLRAPNGERLYKRLGNGRHLISGVCAGIAEATGFNVVTLRVAFLALLFFKGPGVADLPRLRSRHADSSRRSRAPPPLPNPPRSRRDAGPRAHAVT